MSGLFLLFLFSLSFFFFFFFLSTQQISYVSAYGKGADHELASQLSSSMARPDLLMPVDFGVRCGGFCCIRRVATLEGNIRTKRKGKEGRGWRSELAAGNFGGYKLG